MADRQAGGACSSDAAAMIRLAVMLAGLALGGWISGGVAIGAQNPATNSATDITFEQRLGASVPAALQLRSETGLPIAFDTVQGRRPLVLALGYYRCPNLCGLVRADVLSALQRGGLIAGQDYTLLVLSIDGRETLRDAATARRRDLDRFPLNGHQDAIHYLTAPPAALKALEETVGYRASWQQQDAAFAHPAGLVVISPHGLVAQYLPGVGYAPDMLRRAILEARAEQVARPSLILSLPCFHFDPATGRYTLVITKAVRLAALATIVLIGGGMIFLFRRERRS